MGKDKTRFGYLEKSGRNGKKGKTRVKPPTTPPPTDESRDRGRAEGERVAAVYVRRETVQAVWREVKRDGGESLSELVEDLLLAWLRGRTR
ncbi:hypothetical protein [Deinococcus koreensis]|uniref:Uncharacterized protein n=1 Tax=Deinococcus koreensis TaxID=2054903 RepID=A0A2K3UTZ4_9DEIO|nr:hypothetical protein [Deinococcus koreensis]PNY80012.1 hypothetical protein CVO96_00365 [Deinococcus koreensis]